MSIIAFYIFVYLAFWHHLLGIKYTLYKCLILPWLHNIPSINTMCPLKKTQNIGGSITTSDNLRFILSLAKKKSHYRQRCRSGRSWRQREIQPPGSDIIFVAIGTITANNFYDYSKDTCRGAVKTKIQYMSLSARHFFLLQKWNYMNSKRKCFWVYHCTYKIFLILWNHKIRSSHGISVVGDSLYMFGGKCHQT